MQRILDPAQIEAFTERDIPRVRLPDPDVFGQRARRLRALSSNHPLQDYLLLMAALADAQQAEFDSLRSALVAEAFPQELGQQIELAQTHHMPVLQAAGWPRQDRWRAILRNLCGAISQGDGPAQGGAGTRPVRGPAGAGAGAGAEASPSAPP